MNKHSNLKGVQKKVFPLPRKRVKQEKRGHVEQQQQIFSSSFLD